jgi:hypothetical protein
MVRYRGSKVDVRKEEIRKGKGTCNEKNELNFTSALLNVCKSQWYAIYLISNI